MNKSSVPESPRYQNGQFVRIRGVIGNRHVGHVGRVVELKRNKRGLRTLDKYIVSFSTDEQQEFWDIQLEPVPLTKEAANR
jgi:hypothetical protein